MTYKEACEKYKQVYDGYKTSYFENASSDETKRLHTELSDLTTKLKDIERNIPVYYKGSQIGNYPSKIRSMNIFRIVKKLYDRLNY